MGLWNNPPYYMTAYGIAVKHGYRGSEEQWLADLKHPVGAIYLSVDSTSPAVLFGGTWVEIKDKVIAAAGETYTAGETVNVSVGSGSSSLPVLAVYAWKRTK